MFSLKNVKDSMVAMSKNLGMKVSKNSPELLLVAGGIGFAASLVLVGKASIQAKEIVEEHKKTMDIINNAVETESGEEYTEEIRKKDTYICHVKTAGKMCKLFAPAMVCASLSMACFIGSHNIQAGRIAGLTTAYNALNEAFNTYRARVIADQGEDKDFEYRFGAKKDTYSVVDKEGNATGEKVDVYTVKPENLDGEYVFCKKTSDECQGIDVYDDSFLLSKEGLVNYYMNRDGHLMLSDVLKELGMWKYRTIAQKLSDSRIGWTDKNKKVKLNPRKVSVPDYNHSGCFETYYILDPNFDGIIDVMEVGTKEKKA